MTVSKMTDAEREQWRRLFALADELDQLDAWQWMSPADSFGVCVPGWQEPCFVLFSGRKGEFRSVRFLLGWKSFYDMMTRLADPSKQTTTWLLELRMIELLFVNGSLLFKHERPFLREIGRKTTRSFATPIFRSITPGYHPWLPDERERALLADAVYQTLGISMRVEETPTLLQTRLPKNILLRDRDAKGVWQDTWRPVKELDDEEVEVSIESKRLQELSAKPLKPITVQVDLVFTPLRLQTNGARPQTAYILLVVDARNGFIIAGELMQATEGVGHMWSQVPDKMLRVFEQYGGCPETIEVSTDRMANLLRPLGEHLPFKMVRREKLAMLERAREHLSVSITRQVGRKS